LPAIGAFDGDTGAKAGAAIRRPAFDKLCRGAARGPIPQVAGCDRHRAAIVADAATGARGVPRGAGGGQRRIDCGKPCRGDEIIVRRNRPVGQVCRHRLGIFLAGEGNAHDHDMPRSVPKRKFREHGLTI
jgi:hypothetical protein